MRKWSYFASEFHEGWPAPSDIEHYFLGPLGRRWFFETGNDTAGFRAEGVDGTELLKPFVDRVDIDLALWGHPELGVLLIYSRLGGSQPYAFTSKGDLTRLREWVRTMHDDLRPVGLYVPFELAWQAVKEFIDTGGELPKSIEWINNRDLPADSFPDPFEAVPMYQGHGVSDP